MTRVNYIMPLGDGRVLELRVAASPEQFDRLVPVMKKAVETFALQTPRRKRARASRERAVNSNLPGFPRPDEQLLDDGTLRQINRQHHARRDILRLEHLRPRFLRRRHRAGGRAAAC